MRSSKAVSCITYNTEKFLTLKLNELLDACKISFWCFIYHIGEDELKPDGTTVTDKNHIHLHVVPNGIIDTMAIDKILLEKDKKTKSKLPLKPIWWESSDWDNWYLYNSHDKVYLDSKMLVKQYHYQDSDFHSSNPDTFNYLAFRTRHESKLCTDSNAVNYLRQGGNVANLALNGFIKPNQAFSYKCFDDLIKRSIYAADNSAN